MCLVAFFLPFKFLAPTLTSVLVLVWLVQGNFNERFKGVKILPISILISFYCLQLLGMLYTENIQAGVTALEVKMTLLFFPLIFASTSLSAMEVKSILRYFVYGCLFTALICILRSAILFFLHSDASWFFYEKFCWFMHPSYYSMYFTLVIGIVLMDIFYSDQNSFVVLKIALLLFSFLIVLLSASKMGILCTAILVLFSGITYFIRNGRLITVIVFIGALVFSMFILNKVFPESFSRFKNTLDVLNAKDIDKSTTESSGVRLLIWSAASDLMKENVLFGFGTGDANAELQKKYEAEGLTGALERKLNAHNQFIQSWLSHGLIGIVSLLLMIFLPLVPWKSCPSLIVYFVFLVFLNFCVETMLLTQAGTMFFAFFLSLFYYKRNYFQSFSLFDISTP
jgi:O-antigen ligase